MFRVASADVQSFRLPHGQSSQKNFTARQHERGVRIGDCPVENSHRLKENAHFPMENRRRLMEDRHFQKEDGNLPLENDRLPSENFEILAEND